MIPLHNTEWSLEFIGAERRNEIDVFLEEELWGRSLSFSLTSLTLYQRLSKSIPLGLSISRGDIHAAQGKEKSVSPRKLSRAGITPEIRARSRKSVAPCSKDETNTEITSRWVWRGDLFISRISDPNLEVNAEKTARVARAMRRVGQRKREVSEGGESTEGVGVVADEPALTMSTMEIRFIVLGPLPALAACRP